jgi:hypothetical protein
MTGQGMGVRPPAGGGREALRLLLGVVDAGLEQAEHAVRAARGLFGRSDLSELAAAVRADLGARGEVVLGRVAPPAESHMETLARRAREAAERAGGTAPARQAARHGGEAADD